MPEEPGECVIVKTKSLVEGQEWVGATLTVEEDEEDEEEDSSPLPQTLTVVGTVRSAAYVLHGTGIHHRRLRHLGSDALHPAGDL